MQGHPAHAAFHVWSCGCIYVEPRSCPDDLEVSAPVSCPACQADRDPMPQWLAARADGLYAGAYWLYDSARHDDAPGNADLAEELQDRACAIYAEFQL